MPVPTKTDLSRDLSPTHPRAGAALAWISPAVFALALAATFAVPAWQQSQRVSGAQTALADLRRFEDIFQAYAHDHGDWPATAVPGGFPPGLEAALASTSWTKPSPIGGRYAWLVDMRQHGQRLRAVIGIVSQPGNPVSDDRRQLGELLQQARHANLPPSRLRLGFRNEPIFVLEN